MPPPTPPVYSWWNIASWMAWKVWLSMSQELIIPTCNTMVFISPPTHIPIILTYSCTIWDLIILHHNIQSCTIYTIVNKILLYMYLQEYCVCRATPHNLFMMYSLQSHKCRQTAWDAIMKNNAKLMLHVSKLYTTVMLNYLSWSPCGFKHSSPIASTVIWQFSSINLFNSRGILVQWINNIMHVNSLT